MGPQCAPIGCNGFMYAPCRVGTWSHTAPAGQPKAAQSAACVPPETPGTLPEGTIFRGHARSRRGR